MSGPPQPGAGRCSAGTSGRWRCDGRTRPGPNLVAMADVPPPEPSYVRPMTTSTGSVVHLSALPDERARLAPDAPCVDDDRLELTNVEFAQRVQAVAAYFRSRGLGPGDVVAAMLPNRVELI